MDIPWFKFKNPFLKQNSFSLSSFPNLTPSFVLTSRAALFELDVITQIVRTMLFVSSKVQRDTSSYIDIQDVTQCCCDCFPDIAWRMNLEPQGVCNKASARSH